MPFHGAPQCWESASWPRAVLSEDDDRKETGETDAAGVEALVARGLFGQQRPNGFKQRVDRGFRLGPAQTRVERGVRRRLGGDARG